MFVSETYDVMDYLYVPKLDGTETIHQVQGTTTIANGEMSSGSGYIGAFDNTGDWELTFDVKYDGERCGIWLIKSDETSRDTNDILITYGTIYQHANSQTQAASATAVSYNTWYACKLTKQNGALTFTRNNVNTNLSWSLINTLSTLSVGVDAWGSTSHIKNIQVKPL